jgi:hypothetical protein
MGTNWSNPVGVNCPECHKPCTRCTACRPLPRSPWVTRCLSELRLDRAQTMLQDQAHQRVCRELQVAFAASPFNGGVLASSRGRRAMRRMLANDLLNEQKG